MCALASPGCKDRCNASLSLNSAYAHSFLSLSFPRIAQDVFNKLNANGYLEERAMIQLFCEKDQRYLADRYVEGTCPKCGYDVSVRRIVHGMTVTRKIDEGACCIGAKRLLSAARDDSCFDCGTRQVEPDCSGRKDRASTFDSPLRPTLWRSTLGTDNRSCICFLSIRRMHVEISATNAGSYSTQSSCSLLAARSAARHLSSASPVTCSFALTTSSR